MAKSELRQLIEQVAHAVEDTRVLEAMARLPRVQFVPGPARKYALLDSALPIGHKQTISQPTIVGVMTEALELSGVERVLEIGTGSGYQAALLAELAGEVFSVEVVPELRQRAAALLEQLSFDNVTVLDPGETLGAPEHGPFDRIVVTAACPKLPLSLVEQLKVGGVLVLPVGSRALQDLLVIRKDESGLSERNLGGCRFVPLVGPEGFKRHSD